jgi:hypothetical protein
MQSAHEPSRCKSWSFYVHVVDVGDCSDRRRSSDLPRTTGLVKPFLVSHSSGDVSSPSYPQLLGCVPFPRDQRVPFRLLCVIECQLWAQRKKRDSMPALEYHRNRSCSRVEDQGFSLFSKRPVRHEISKLTPYWGRTQERGFMHAKRQFSSEAKHVVQDTIGYTR